MNVNLYDFLLSIIEKIDLGVVFLVVFILNLTAFILCKVFYAKAKIQKKKSLILLGFFFLFTLSISSAITINKGFFLTLPNAGFSWLYLTVSLLDFKKRVKVELPHLQVIKSADV